MEENELKKDEEIDQRVEKLKKWFYKPENILLTGLLIFSFIILIYYFNITQNQPLWWDEGEYMSTANYWALGIPYDIHPARPPLFPFLAAILIKIGFGLLGVKFLLELVPAILSILFIYKLIIEMYNDRKLALITGFILSVSWIHIFYTMRMMTDELSFLFGILAILCFWKGYVHDKGKIYIWLVGLFVALAFLSRLTGVLYGVFLIIFLLFTDRLKFFKNKNIWIALLIAFLTITPYLIWSYSYFGNAFAFREGYGGVTESPLGWWMLKLVFDYPEMGFFITFLIGIITLLPMFLGLDQLIFNKEKKYYADFFNLLIILFTLGFFIYFLRDGENRWLMMMSIGIFTISAKGILSLYKLSRKKTGKILSVLILMLLLFFGAFYEIRHADIIINFKKDSYLPVKEAALWMKDNSNYSDVIISTSKTQMPYYAERKVIAPYNYEESREYTQEEFSAVFQKYKPKYYVVSIFETYFPPWTYTYPQNKSNFVPVKAWFADQEKQQPILIIYEINYSDNS
ncbi:MAG: glycosyltransferase family 39 protein [Candidatus Pacearchaeota archaeon]